MAIQQRRGSDADFDASKMLPAEIAVTTDGSRKVYVAFAPSDVKELASKEEVQAIVDDFNENMEENIRDLAIKTPSVHQLARFLSGGGLLVIMTAPSAVSMVPANDIGMVMTVFLHGAFLLLPVDFST